MSRFFFLLGGTGGFRYIFQLRVLLSDMFSYLFPWDLKDL